MNVIRFNRYAVVLICIVLLFTDTVRPEPDKGKFNSADCTFNGIKLYGKVKVVEQFPDIRVQVVTAFPDLKVKWVEQFPDSCGKWQPVEHFPDFTIQYVNSFPDIKIKLVEHFPGAD